MRVTGAVEIRKGATARIRVISFKRKNVFVDDPEELRDIFLPEGLVFAPVLPEKFEIGAVIEFQANPDSYNNLPTGDHYILDKNSPVSFTGREVIQMPYYVLTEGTSVDLDQVDSSNIRPNSEFFLQINQFLYGPFSKRDEDIQSKKDAFQLPADQVSLFPVGNKLYMLGTPLLSVRCDAMNQDQLADWFKDLLRSLDPTLDVSRIRQLIGGRNQLGLDDVRLKRALNILDRLALNERELKTLAGITPDLQRLYDDALQRIYEDIAAPAVARKKMLREEIDMLNTEADELKNELTERKEQLAATTAELENTEREKHRLIADIRVHALVGETKIAVEEHLIKFECQRYEGRGTLFAELGEFIKLFRSTIKNEPEEFGKAAHKMLLQFRDHRSILCADVTPVLQLAFLSNNSYVFLQQVEPDWLKYDFLHQNGLKQAWASAMAEPQVIHLLILQDLNMASIECYGKPLTDIISGIRISLPGLKGPIPQNLWIIGIPLPVFRDQDFGLPMLEQTFKNWGAVPVCTGPWEFTKSTSTNVLGVSTLIQHDDIAGSSLSDYFQTT
jgi:hypothetical protein